MSRESTEEDDEEDSEEDSEAALEALGPPPFYRSLLVLAEMSSKDNYFTPQYTEACVKHARLNKDFVMGFIAQRSLNSDKHDNFITMTPGVQLSAGGDDMGQQYNTPRKIIGDAGCDIMIVGRGILRATDRKRAALEYRKQGWNAYEERLRASRRRR
jgi:uridine monophosphate synthetase